MDRVLGYIGYAVIIAFALGWMDTLAMLGVEDSRSFEWGAKQSSYYHAWGCCSGSPIFLW
jgi:hypothetical protein